VNIKSKQIIIIPFILLIVNLLFSNIIVAEPVVEGRDLSPFQPSPMSNVILTVGINNSTSIKDVRLIVEECSDSINYADKMNISMDYSYTCCKDFYQIEFNLTHEDATHIKYFVLINDNNSWYQSEIWATNLSIDNNDYCICDYYEYKTPGFELIISFFALILILIYKRNMIN
jgi:hypothetical protein